MARWDIFCTVVDNFGDIGVAWRLARQLACERQQSVRLWVDDLSAFQRIWPTLDPLLNRQTLANVDIRAWPSSWLVVDAADVVIEMFACAIPEPYRQAMRHRTPPPLWINLEYLSAEAWISDCHLLPSIQPDGLSKFFFFPGFQEPSGGLLREDGLLSQRRQFQRTGRGAFLKELGVQYTGEERIVSLFSYEQPRLGDWLTLLAGGRCKTVLLVPEGKVSADIVRCCGRGDVVVQGALEIRLIPFLDQTDYDRLLWACDLNMVRGEDSFVRAQWAGVPFIWQIYPQADNMHLFKLQAFLDRYTASMPPALAKAVMEFTLFWNGSGDGGNAWPLLCRHWEKWRRMSEIWCESQERRCDLATRLAQFCLNSL